MKKILMLLPIVYLLKNAIASNLPDSAFKSFLLGLPDVNFKIPAKSSDLDPDVIQEDEVFDIDKPDTNTDDHLAIFDSGATADFARKHPNLVYESTKSRTGFRVKNSAKENMKPRALTMYQDFKSRTSVSHTMNSGYRNRAYNALVGGSSTSTHMDGGAFDLGIHPTEQEQAAFDLLDVGFRRLGFYTWGVHAGYNPSKPDLVFCDEDALITVKAMSEVLKAANYSSVLCYMNDGTRQHIEL